MSTRKKKRPSPGELHEPAGLPVTPVNQASGYPPWFLSSFVLISFIAAFVLYGPALNGPFLFDDIGLPFYSPVFADKSLSAWLSGVRPLVMLSYWINFQLSARDSWSYHALNVLLHISTSTLLLIAFHRILRLMAVDSRKAPWIAGIAAFLFLVHPLQTESVAYIAGRSELLCGFFSVAALAIFCNPSRDRMSWPAAIIILILYALAALSKEQAVVLPVLFLALDLVVRRRSLGETLRLSSRLYYPLAVMGTMAVIGVTILLSGSSTAGFRVPGIRWYEYVFTQFRMWLMYTGLAVLPLNQNADYDLPVSHSLAQYGSAIALVVLLAAAYGAWKVRDRYPLAFAGLLAFAILLAPTSSLIPIEDVAAERRMYLPLAGLLMVLMQVLIRVRLTAALTGFLLAGVLIFAALTHERSKLWSSDVAFWSDIVQRSPGKSRGYTHLAYAYARTGRCSEAVKMAGRAPEPVRNTPEFLGVLGHAYACDGRMEQAVASFERAVEVAPGAGRYLALAAIYRRVGRQWDAQLAEERALKIPPKTAYDFTMLDAFQQARAQLPVGAGRSRG